LATLALVAGAFRSTKRREQRLRRIGSSRVALGGRRLGTPLWSLEMQGIFHVGNHSPANYPQ
jgi:hypothetical protein